MCCSVSTGPDAVRGRPLHSSELYDERLGVWIPAQGLKLGRQNLGACSVGSGVVALGGLVAGKVVPSPYEWPRYLSDPVEYETARPSCKQVVIK